jgi:hypothetical protein
VPAACPIGRRFGCRWTVSTRAGPSCRAWPRAGDPAPPGHAGTPWRLGWRSGPCGSSAQPARRPPHRSACCRYGGDHEHQAAPLRGARAGACVGLRPWGGPADTRRPKRRRPPLINQAHLGARSQRCTVPSSSATRLSRSRPPRQGRSLQSRRMRSASPNLDPASTRQDPAPIEEEGEGPGSCLAGCYPPVRVR